MNPDHAYVEARATVARQQVAALEALMEAQGAVAVTLTDVADVPVLEPGVGETPLWPRVEVCGLFAADIPEATLRNVLSLAPGVESGGRVRINSLTERDWVRAWHDDLRPLRFGEQLWVVPTPIEPPEPDATVIRLDPGMAFGSGTHSSTRLCLEWIDAQDLAGQVVVDYGCGSGVLAVAAALKGARRVMAVDNDPQALLATTENAARNGVGDRVQVTAPEDFAVVGADLVLANILSGTLIRLAATLKDAVRPGGVIVLAGILAGQADEVAAAFSDRFPSLESVTLDEWVRLSGSAKG